MKNFALPGSVTINAVHALVADLKGLDCTEGALALDISGIEAITTPGVQLLIAFEKALKDAGAALMVTGQNPLVTDAFHTLGVAEIFKTAMNGSAQHA